MSNLPMHVYDSAAIQLFLGIDLGRDAVPDASKRPAIPSGSSQSSSPIVSTYF